MAFSAVLIAGTLLCALVAGFLFAFAVVVMPGIRTLDDRGYLRAFQAVDGVIQRGSPLFMITWIGPMPLLGVATALGGEHLDDTGLTMLLTALALYVLGVQVPTAVVNIPLNNAVRDLEIDALDDAGAAAERARFERRWNRSNVARTFVSTAVTALLLTVLASS